MSSFFKIWLTCNNEDDWDDEGEPPKPLNWSNCLKNIKKINNSYDLYSNDNGKSINNISTNYFIEDAYEYYGGIVNNLKDGKGLLISKTCNKYLGKFSSNKKGGNFLRINISNEIFIQCWENDCLINEELIIIEKINYDWKNELLLKIEIPEYNFKEDSTKDITPSNIDLDFKIVFDKIKYKLLKNNLKLDYTNWTIIEFKIFLNIYDLTGILQLLKNNSINYYDILMLPEYYENRVNFNDKGSQILFDEFIEKILILEKFKKKRNYSDYWYNDYKRSNSNKPLKEYNELKLNKAYSNSNKIKNKDNYLDFIEYIDKSLKYNNLNTYDIQDLNLKSQLFKSSFFKIFQANIKQNNLLLLELENNEWNFNMLFNTLKSLNNQRHPNLLMYNGIANNKENLYIVYEVDNYKNITNNCDINNENIFAIYNNLIKVFSYLNSKGIKNFSYSLKDVLINDKNSVKLFLDYIFFNENKNYLLVKNQEYFYLALIIIELKLKINFDADEKFEIMKNYIYDPLSLNNFIFEINNIEIKKIINSLLVLFNNN